MTDSVLWPAGRYVCPLYEMTSAFPKRKTIMFFCLAVDSLPSSYHELKGFGTSVIILGPRRLSLHKLKSFMGKALLRPRGGGAT